MAKSVKSVKATLSHAKETSGTHQYKEEAEKGKQVIGTLYVPKHTLSKFGEVPDEITVTVAIAE